MACLAGDLGPEVLHDVALQVNYRNTAEYTGIAKRFPTIKWQTLVVVAKALVVVVADSVNGLKG